MKLYEYLIKNGVKSKKTIDFLMKNRMVTVNDKIVTYPDTPINEKDKVEVLNNNYMDAPDSFWEMKEIDEEVELIQRGDFVLDIESCDGGFPLYCARNGGNTTLVTIRDDLSFLEKDDVEIIKKNIIFEELKNMISTKFDIVIIEIKLDIIKVMQLLEKIRSCIGSRGKLLLFIPSKGRSNIKEMTKEMLIKQKLEVKKFFETRKGIYVYAKVF